MSFCIRENYLSTFLDSKLVFLYQIEKCEKVKILKIYMELNKLP